MVLGHDKSDPCHESHMAHARAHDAYTEIRSRLSPSRLGDVSLELAHRHRYLVPLPIARILYICYLKNYGARHDIRCFLQRPNIVSRAINRNIAYVYYTRDRYRYGISTSVRELRAVGPKPARR